MNTKENLIEKLKYKPYWRSIHSSDIYVHIIDDMLEYINDKDIEQAYRYLERIIEIDPD